MTDPMHDIVYGAATVVDVGFQRDAEGTWQSAPTTTASTDPGVSGDNGPR